MMFTNELLREAIENSNSWRGVARYLGIKYRSDLKSVLIKNVSNFDISHFTHGKKYKSLLGKKFNKLTILSLVEGDKRKYYCKCICDCGKESIKRVDAIKSGTIISCGCAIVDKGRFMIGPNNHSFTGIGTLGSVKFEEIKRNAKRRKIEFNVTKEYLWKCFEEQKSKCALTGEELFFGRQKVYSETNASLDRIDSSKGYIEGNVQWVHKDINLMKRSFDEKYFKEMCKRVTEKLTRKSEDEQ